MRREIHERFEDRTGLPAGRRCTVVLRLVVGTSANQRKNFACLRIDGDERGLRATFALSPRQHLVYSREAVAHRLEREALKIDVECRMDADSVRLRRQPVGAHAEIVVADDVPARRVVAEVHDDGVLRHAAEIVAVAVVSAADRRVA